MSFPARYTGRCSSCENLIEIGQTVSMVDSDRGRVIVHADHLADGEVHVEARTTRIDTIATMPRGRTAKDRCGDCFQVPASNGACGCDS